MALSSCSLCPISKSIVFFPSSISGIPNKSLGYSIQTMRRPKCFDRFLLKCVMRLRGSRVTCFRSQLGFCEFPKILEGEIELENQDFKFLEGQGQLLLNNKKENRNDVFWRLCGLSAGLSSWLGFCQVAQSSIGDKTNLVYETGELFELGIQLSYLLILLGLLGLGTFYVIRQVLVRRELDLSAKELQEQVRSGDATATGYFELGAVMLRRKFYPAAIKYLQQAIEKWDRDDQDLAQVYNALGVCYVRENKLEKGITQFEAAVKLQPGYITAWNNLGDAYEKKKDLRSALKAFEEALLFDPNNKVARPRRDALRERLLLFKGVPIKSEEQ